MGEIARQFGNTYRGRRGFVTGHTNIKGTWLSLWLTQLGADIGRYFLGLPTEPCNFGILQS